MLRHVYSLIKDIDPENDARQWLRYSKLKVEDGLVIIGTYDAFLEIAMSLADKDFGYIYLWDRQETCMRLLHPLMATSFSDFLEQIHDFTAENVQKVQDEHKRKQTDTNNDQK